MCFSATSSFIAAGVLGGIGVATLRHVREPRALLFAAVPLLFAFHQAAEGTVWLGLNGQIGKLALDHAAFLFTVYAQGILPFLMPLAIALMEPRGWRRIAIVALTGIGLLVGLWDLFGLVFYPSEVFVSHHSIAYRNPLTGGVVIPSLYVLATCGAMLLSTHRVVRAYGVVNVIGLTIVGFVKGNAFASVWCFYAATLSVMLYWQFAHRTIDVETPNGTSPVLRPLLLPWLRWRGEPPRPPS